jgi:DNA polymerase-3 subunit delta
MPHTQIIKDIKQGKVAPVYLIGGEEAFFVDEVSQAIENDILDDAEKSFNMDIFYGMESDPATVVSIAKQYPMMAERRLVIIKEAQKVRDLGLIEEYINAPVESTTLLIAMKGKNFDSRKNVFNPKKNPHIVLFNGKKIPDYKLAPWIIDYCKKAGYTIDPIRAQILTDHLGNDISKLVNELGKLFINKEKGAAITAEDIEQKIGISKDFTIFELQKAIGIKDFKKANQIVLYYANNLKSHPFPILSSNLFSYFNRLMLFYYSKDKSDATLAKVLGVNPYFVGEYRTAAKNYSALQVVNVISLIREYDLKSKGLNVGENDHGEWMKELLFKIMH